MKQHHLYSDKFAATIGLDWANAKHDICLQVAGSHNTEHLVLQHRPETIDAWARELRQRFRGQPVALTLELFKDPIVSALTKYDFFVLFPVNPATLAKYRETWTHSGAKDDPTDAELALELLIKHPERFQPVNPQSPRMRALEQLNEHRRRLVDDQIRITNRLTDVLKQYFPQPLQYLRFLTRSRSGLRSQTAQRFRRAARALYFACRNPKVCRHRTGHPTQW